LLRHSIPLERAQYFRKASAVPPAPLTYFVIKLREERLESA
jgi:hypothetical protein